MNGEKIICRETPLAERGRVIKFFYEKESEVWHREVHKKGGTLSQNIDDTLGSISEESVMYELFCGMDLAAFFVRYMDEYGNLALEGFHVLDKYRNADFLNAFWKTVREVFGKMFWVGLYIKNEQAVKHLVKQGFSFEKTTEVNNSVFLIFKSE